MKKRDFIFIGAILAVALILFAIQALTQDYGEYVVVRVDGKEVARYDLNENGEYVLNGGTNILKVENGEAWMLEADCPQISGKKCTAQGKISKERQTITCSPNKLTVTAYGKDNDVDFVSD
jgi:hypothetical protein